MKRIVKRNNESSNLEILNLLITIDYVLPKAITWLRRRQRIQSIVFVHVLNRNIIIVKRNSEILCCYISIFVVSTPSGCPFHLIQPNLCLYFFKKKLFLKSFHWKQYELQLNFVSRPISSIKTLREIALNLSHFEKRNMENIMLESITCEAFLHDLFLQLLLCGLRKRKYLTYNRLASPWICAAFGAM